MSTLSSNEWQALSPWLDEALELRDEERSVWLISMRVRNPELAARLETLLEEHRALSDEGFLEESAGLSGGLGLVGQTFGVYTLLSQIGQGGMGSVWLAERSDGRFDRRVAVKALNFALIGSGGEERFKREGSILGRLSHAHIAQLYDAGVSPAGQRIWSWNMWMVFRSISIATGACSGSKRGSGFFSTCWKRSRTLMTVKSFTATLNHRTCWSQPRVT